MLAAASATAPASRASSAVASRAVKPPGIRACRWPSRPVRSHVEPGRGGNRSRKSSPTAATMSAAPQPAWQKSRIRPSSPSVSDKLGDRSACPGHRAIQRPRPVPRTDSRRSSSVSTGALTARPSPATLAAIAATAQNQPEGSPFGVLVFVRPNALPVFPDSKLFWNNQPRAPLRVSTSRRDRPCYCFPPWTPRIVCRHAPANTSVGGTNSGVCNPEIIQRISRDLFPAGALSIREFLGGLLASS